MTLRLCLQTACLMPGLPSKADFRRWAGAALEGRRELAEITVRLVDEAESRKLNLDYRGYDRSTNILSFPWSVPKEFNSHFLGDLAICAPGVKREAVEQGKEPEAHWAHLVVHGVLHLLGFDHENLLDAEAMESQEISILGRLGYPNPYMDDDVV